MEDKLHFSGSCAGKAGPLGSVDYEGGVEMGVKGVTRKP